MKFEDMINTIQLGDCYEMIKQIPDNSIDLVVIDPPYQFCAGGNGSSDIAKRKYNQKQEMYSLDTDITKRKVGTGYSSGGGCCWYICTKNNRKDGGTSMNTREHYEKCKDFKSEVE